MSRVGKQPITIPDGVTVTFADGVCSVAGPKGELSEAIRPEVRVSVADGEVVVTRPNDQPQVRALHGLSRALIQNMVIGVTDGYRKSLELRGTGYRALLQGDNLVLTVGFSHSVELEPIEGAAFDCESQTLVHIDGISKQVVGQQAALVRRVRPPEPYHGKGIRYVGEFVRLKAGKAKA